jgi:hypothetical protein
MTFILDAQQDKPQGLFNMDDTTPLQDYSAYNRTATIAGGTPTQAAGLVKGAAWAPIFTSTITAAFDSGGIFSRNAENLSFTLAGWFRAVASDSNEQQLLGNSGQMDGLTIKGTVVSFVTKFASTGEARASFDLQIPQAFSAYGVHTDTKNILYINGVVVAETVITDVQQADTYVTTSSNFICGTTSGSAKVAVNAVAYYPYALSPEAISRQHATGRRTPEPQDIVLMNFGDYIPLDLSNSDLFLDQLIDTDDEWRHGLFDNTDVVDNVLVPTQDASGTSVSSRWYYSVDLATTANSATVYGVQLDWDGIGATVSVSLDGTTWENVSRGVNCTTVPAGTTTSGKVLQIRVAFAGGTLNDTSSVKSLNIIGIRQAVSKVTSGRTVTPTGSWPERDHNFLEYHENDGIMIPSSATVVVSADTVGASVTRSIELLIKRNGTNPTVSLTGTNYINGAAGSATLLDGVWLLWHIVLAADSSSNITITGPAQVAYVGVYDYALSAGQVAAIYADYVGTDAPRFSDASVVSLSESAAAAQIAAHDWSITASG